MIDEIFAMIMKEARQRRGKNLIKNISIVCMEITERILAAVEAIRQEQSKKNNHED